MSFKPAAGEWFPISKKLKVVCCDCRLVHRYEFELRKGELWMRGFRDNKSTYKRRHKKNCTLKLGWIKPS